jgi:UDP-N-acetylmuramoylalanine--D-glutamate ligase
LNNELETYKKNIKEKKVAVLGIGISNIPLIKYLAGLDVNITAFDMSEETELKQVMEEFKGFNVKYSLGSNYLEKLKGFDIIFKTPKVRFDIPELVMEKERGADITSEMELFCKLCPAKILAVTGSDGKTTTTTLIYKLLKEQGYNCWLGGNIGIPLLDRIDEICETDIVVLELSSFQLHTMKSRINTAIVTNVSPNHLDVHKSMEEYIDAKKNIFKFQAGTDTLILNYDNVITRNLINEAKGRVMYFSRANCIDEGIVLEDGRIVSKTGKGKLTILNVDEILLPGVHNIENYMAAIAATVDYVKPETARRVASTFKGVEHRIEYVREIRKVRFYNDSIGSSPTRTMASINSFKQKIILIAGGYDKHIPYTEMGETLTERVKCIVLLGQTGPLIEEALKEETAKTGKGSDIPVIKCETLEDAVNAAYENSVENDIILMSPASASFDMFKNFEERGNKFKEIVNCLK